ncbi:MAG: hypothetical protein RL701_7825 [Pseudomonadota bacterium]
MLGGEVRVEEQTHVVFATTVVLDLLQLFEQHHVDLAHVRALQPIARGVVQVLAHQVRAFRPAAGVMEHLSIAPAIDVVDGDHGFTGRDTERTEQRADRAKQVVREV